MEKSPENQGIPDYQLRLGATPTISAKIFKDHVLRIKKVTQAPSRYKDIKRGNSPFRHQRRLQSVDGTIPDVTQYLCPNVPPPSAGQRPVLLVRI